jgi:hypothetical protein
MDPEDELAAQRKRRRYEKSPEEDRILTLQEHTGTGASVILETHEPDGTTRGFILAMSREVVLMHECNGFDPDGYVLIPVHQIAGILEDDGGPFWDGIMRAEGRLGGLTLGFEVDLSSMEAAMRSVVGRYPTVSLATDGLYLLGFVLAIEKGVVRVHGLESDGIWEESAEEVELDEIAQLRFATPYVTMMLKHSPPRPRLDEEK